MLPTNMAIDMTNGSIENPLTLQKDDLREKDMTIEINTSELENENENKETNNSYKYGFSVGDLYKISLQFYKAEKQNLAIAYEKKVRLLALWKQVSCGRYEESKMPDVGYFDIIGNDRRKVWQSLGDMKPDIAKENFCSLIDEISPNFKEYALDRRRKIDEEIERKRLEEELRIQKEKELQRIAEQERIRKEEERRIQLALEAEKLKMKEEEEREQEKQASKNGSKAETPTFLTAQGDVDKAISPASLWTRPKLQEFITHVKRDASSVLVVGRGETVTIRVPTHEEGSCLFWEFATESYDVGFGVFFEWANNHQGKFPLMSRKISVNESDNDSAVHDEENAPANPVIVNENEDNREIANNENIDQVLPVLRRNSHEQVIVGSHLYPGKGIYLLKFDNSYSLLRSKTLYYRVYYTK